MLTGVISWFWDYQSFWKCVLYTFLYLFRLSLMTVFSKSGCGGEAVSLHFLNWFSCSCWVFPEIFLCNKAVNQEDPSLHSGQRLSALTKHTSAWRKMRKGSTDKGKEQGAAEWVVREGFTEGAVSKTKPWRMQSWPRKGVVVGEEDR